ncbi:MAG TPA: response regulator [Caldisericia bacterium]|jgi:CheY-like chemotaxis protein|nr:response regulator [Caldisericia bacterium]MCE5176844.1 response regulator [bacterium]NMD14067.1 response regulator [Caldisericales bacterium]MBP6929211.1 response regulator [Caldisericia bacterium]HOR46935.1 response regulator [Caldisericia bacterium]
MPNSKKKILVVDDDVDYLFQQRVQLESAGFEVKTAETQADGEKMLAEEKPDLVIVDLMMENMDAGFSLAYHIKSKYPGIPVIMVTGVTSETGLEFSAGGGNSWIKADALLAKPIRFEQLLGEINKLLKGK